MQRVICQTGWRRRMFAARGFADARQQHGFTLLEIMVVVVLIALTVSLVGLNLGRDIDQVAELEAQRFAKLIEHVRDESILMGKAYAVEVDEQNKSYSFLEFAEKWLPVGKDDVLRQRYVPEYLSIRFDLPQEPEKKNGRRLLVVQGMGEIAPFQLVVAGDKSLFTISLDDALNVQVTQTAKDEF